MARAKKKNPVRIQRKETVSDDASVKSGRVEKRAGGDGRFDQGNKGKKLKKSSLSTANPDPYTRRELLRSYLSSLLLPLRLSLKFNPISPRRGAFEIYIVTKSGEDHNIWSGLKKGPPRKNKFPDTQTLFKNMKSQL
ncbi:unnamed protein product [Lepeophtheirus salmonis]|uniref:(salmon louse) hypothetical protein n=1 Tax=Lepeophtheirus salmonis TaxID=72036 RepID=A0A7R8CGX0_LEPSM|nr:unnamed protein product [Lepeophtheirus salmonis]CAF2813679.1 unnamed protein product [Lepeophtheirus salmonis]